MVRSPKIFSPALATRYCHFPPIRHSSSFTTLPAPPRLPKEEQELYESLQRASTGAFSTPNPSHGISSQDPISNRSSITRPPQVNQSRYTQDLISKDHTEGQNLNARLQASGDGEELHPDVRRGTKEEFEGDRNPKTGEVGGPKNEPLRWGGNVDWSYNGRVTDF
ncbi:MAG: hypothetical protein LQ342_006327 [Letrouitia transgressa]|nr:MAG: hypothetical protein LQ342_006327 [Letrouitia transgressa]